MKITLDGHIFETKSGSIIKRQPIQEWPDNIRLDGQQQRKDRKYLSSMATEDWSGGLGVSNAGATSNRLWDVEDCDTRFPNQITLSPQMVTCTIAPSRADLKLHVGFGNELYFCEVNRVGSGFTNGATPSPPAYPSFAYKYNPPNTLGSNSYLSAFTSGSTQSVGFSVGSLMGVVANDTSGWVHMLFKYSHLGSLPTNVFARGLMGAAVQNIDDISITKNIGSLNIGRLAQFSMMGVTTHMITQRTNNIVDFWVMADNLVTMSQVGSISSTIGSYLAPLQSDGVKVYANLPKGIYDFDITPDLVVSTEQSKDKNNMQTFFQNNLFFKNKNSLIEYDGSDLKGVGFDRDDGLPTDKWGAITAMCASWQWLYTAVKGATYSHILTKDKNDTWQYYGKIPSASVWVKEMFLDDNPDGIDRLWFVFDNAAQPGFFYNPRVNPLSAGTYQFVPSGYFTRPIMDGGMAEEDGVFLDSFVNGESISANNPIYVKYAVDGTISFTALNTITTIGQAAHTFGSPVGLQGRKIQMKYGLERQSGQVGTTPVFRSAVVHYYKDPPRREMYDIVIDLKASTKDTEAAVATLNAIRDKVVLVPFWYGLVGTKYVKVMDIPSGEHGDDNSQFGMNREGLVSLRLVELY